MTTPPHGFWVINSALCIVAGMVAGAFSEANASGKWFTQALICISTYCILTEIKRKK